MTFSRLSFQFDGTTYTSFKAYGKAIMEKFFPYVKTNEMESQDYYAFFSYIAKASTKEDLKKPSVSASFNYCRWYYYANIAREQNTMSLLDEYYGLRSKADGSSLVDKYQEEAIIMVFEGSRGF